MSPDVKSEQPKVVTRIYFTPSGDLIVTDLWNEVRELLGSHFELPDADEETPS